MTTLTDEQCDEFRRMPCSFNDMIRAAYRAGQESMRDKLDQQWNAGFDAGKAAGAKAMRERAAKVCDIRADEAKWFPAEIRKLIDCAAAVRALPVE
jgi:hypothetical protein